MNRREYWDGEYAEYWKKMTDEAEERQDKYSSVKKISGHDFKTGDIELATSFFEWIDYGENDIILDFGCGLGRFFPFLSDRGEYYGIDISSVMIDSCKKTYPKYADRFILAEGERLPFADSFFDKVICYAVFDACFQEDALREMFRVTKVGGEILISGKNNNYMDDDIEAIIAEENARKKGHPNYFTDCKEMINQIIESAVILNGAFSLRRGDLAQKKFSNKMGAQFYEWVILIRKLSDCENCFYEFSDEYSLTYRRIEKN